jgi:glucokinase
MTDPGKPFAVGIDLGGTNIKGGLIACDGAVVARTSVPTEVEGGVDHVIDRIASVVGTVIRDGGATREQVAAVCVGSPGPLDHETGVIHEAPNLRWFGVPLADLLADRVGLRVFVENDANVAAFGEAWAGAAMNFDCVVLLTLGTGIGGGIVINGQVWRGVTGVAGELGHVPIDYNGRPCNCGSRGCIEAYASATAVAARMREAVEAGGESVLRDRVLAGEDVDAKAIHDAAVAGDPLSRRIMEETGRFLGIAVAAFVNIFNPNYVVLHGGMVDAGEMLLGPLREEMSGRCFESAQTGLQIVPSALKGNAGIVGAAGCAFMRAGNGG